MNFLRRLLPAARCLLVCSTFPGAGLAATHLVDSIAALQAQIRAAAPGDVITLKAGVYTTSGPLTVRRAGTAAEPIVIAAETVGGAEIAGTHGFNIVEPSEHIVISGFRFTHAAGRNTIGAGTSHVRFTRNVFQCSGDGAYLSVAGDDAQIDHNEFADKRTTGSMLAVGGTGSQVARRVWIHHNFFHDLASPGASEMLRFGLTALSLSAGAGIVEHNLFARCRGDNELVSNRASGIVYRHNTFVDSPSAQFTLRHGHDCIVHGNTLRGTEGLRIFGDRHLIHSNQLERNYIGINLGNGSGEVADGAPATAHDRPDHCVIVFNTLVDNRTHFQMSRRTPDPLGAAHTTFAHNVLQGGATAAKIEGPYASPTWRGNILANVAAAGDLPPDGYTEAEPLVVRGEDGTHRIRADSTVIGAVAGAFPAVATDIDGQPRGERKTPGADEPANEPAQARVLTPDDVGPHAASAGSGASAGP